MPKTLEAPASQTAPTVEPSKFGAVRWQHDSDSPVHEAKLQMNDGRKMSVGDGASCDRPEEELRVVHSNLIWRVNSSMGGWCETYYASGHLAYRHHPDQLRRGGASEG